MDILIASPTYFFQEYTGQTGHIFFMEGHLLEDEIYDAFQWQLDFQAIQDVCAELEQYGQYTSITQNILTKLYGLQLLFEEYIHATQDNIDSVQIRIETLWDSVHYTCLYCRQYLSSIAI